MKNTRTRRINWKPRYTQFEAYDLLPPDVQKALQEGPTQWDTCSVLRHYRKLLRQGKLPCVAEEATAELVRSWHIFEIRDSKKIWCQRRPGQAWKNVPDSPHNKARATMVVSRGAS